MIRLSRFALATVAACLSAGIRADTVCSKPMLQNAYGFSGTGNGYSSLRPTAFENELGPISCGVGGVLTLGGVNASISRLSEVCASNAAVKTANFGDPTGTQVYQSTKYELNLTTCTANIEFSALGTGGFASLQVTFTDNGQALHFTFERTDFNSYGVTGAGTGSRL